MKNEHSMESNPVFDSPARPIFIGGSGRCGTTLMMHALNAHPEIFSFGESKLMEHEVLRLFPTALFANDDKDAAIEVLKEYIRERVYKFTAVMGAAQTEEERFQAAGLFHWCEREDIERNLIVLDELKFTNDQASASRVIGRYFEKVFQAAAVRRGCTLWSEKTPTNGLYVEVLKQMFPDMKFLYLIRDGRDVINSVMKTSWAMPSLEDAMKWWRESVLEFFLRAKSFNFESVLIVRFEDLVDCYEMTMVNVLDFLELPHRREVENVEARRGATGEWRDKWSGDDCRRYEEICGELHTKLGYSF